MDNRRRLDVPWMAADPETTAPLWRLFKHSWWLLLLLGLFFTRGC